MGKSIFELHPKESWEHVITTNFDTLILFKKEIKHVQKIKI